MKCDLPKLYLSRSAGYSDANLSNGAALLGIRGGPVASNVLGDMNALRLRDRGAILSAEGGWTRSNALKQLAACILTLRSRLPGWLGPTRPFTRASRSILYKTLGTSPARIAGGLDFSPNHHHLDSRPEALECCRGHVEASQGSRKSKSWELTKEEITSSSHFS